jgi:hypothetical protein
MNKLRKGTDSIRSNNKRKANRPLKRKTNITNTMIVVLAGGIHT